MTDQWYYWHEIEVLGPFSGKQLVDLATAGTILPDDIVWKEGVEGGVAASNVQHLFAVTALPTVTATTAVSETAPSEAAAAPALVVSPVEEPAKPTWDRGPGTTSGKARAVAGKGTVIVGQDGKTVKFRMKCIVCNFEDSSWKNMTITRGTTRKQFYCPKCRKKCAVEIHGVVS